MRIELDKIPSTVQSIESDEQYHEILGFCILFSGYVAIRVVGNQWPNEAGVRRIAQNTARAAVVAKKFELDEADVHSYLTRCALGFEPLEQVFPAPGEAAMLPLIITAGLLLTFCPPNTKWWEFLETIEEATELAGSVNAEVVFPAIMLRVRMHTVRSSR
jgi:hypothetical protein